MKKVMYTSSKQSIIFPLNSLMRGEDGEETTTNEGSAESDISAEEDIKPLGTNK